MDKPEYHLMITYFLCYFRGSTFEFIHEKLFPLKNISDYGVSIFIDIAIKKGYVVSKIKNGIERYYSTKFGKKISFKRFR